ncbi:MAG TPA: hypothetical protein VEV20_08550 [Burkholderiales bacterium]|nr:hypothetical protein [Burkholderiales bacterium]
MQAKLRGLAKRLALAVILGGCTWTAAAHDLTLNECIEGSDFIMHAAMSRDYGVTRETFLNHMQTDLQAIQQFPPELRWFVQDRDDEQLLVQAAQSVFDDPREPTSHQSEFLTTCVERVGRGPDAYAGQAALSATVPEVSDPLTGN